MLGESLLIAVLGGAIGLALCKGWTLLGDPTGGFLPKFILNGTAIGLGAVASVLVGVLAGMLPAVSAVRLRVVDALRRV